MRWVQFKFVSSVINNNDVHTELSRDFCENVFGYHELDIEIYDQLIGR